MTPSDIVLRLAFFVTLLIGVLAIASCTPAPTASVCPALIPWTDAAQAEAADELEAPPPKPALTQAVADYITTRARLRACQ